MYIFNNHFYIDKMTTLKYQFKGWFSVSIKLSKNVWKMYQ